ncbi:MAG: Molybdopterin adenylyltransferase [Phycisphaerae bacterium]|nr:Molybdopterin adenylyltransferase [Phycisphaerae bacterium]
MVASDRASTGERDDKAGPLLVERLRATGAFYPPQRRVVPDDEQTIAAALTELSARTSLIVTTGGTGIGPRDVTPEATRRVIDRELPGFGEVMRGRFFDKSPMTILSRGLAGVRGRCLIVNLPGSPAGAAECLDALLPAIRHALDLLSPSADTDARVRHQHGEA